MAFIVAMAATLRAITRVRVFIFNSSFGGAGSRAPIFYTAQSCYHSKLFCASFVKSIKARLGAGSPGPCKFLRVC